MRVTRPKDVNYPRAPTAVPDLATQEELGCDSEFIVNDEVINSEISTRKENRINARMTHFFSWKTVCQKHSTHIFETKYVTLWQ